MTAQRLLFVVALALLVASPARAQDVAADASPLLIAAEEDCAADRVAMCRRRAALAVALLPERSTLRVRAQALLALTEGTSSSEIVPLDDALAPLLAAAEMAAARDDSAAALAYVAALRMLAAADSPLVARAAALGAIPPPASDAAVVVPPGYGESAAPASELAVPRPPAAVDDEVPGAPEEEDHEALPPGFHRRDDGEMVDFYVMAGAAGAGFTTYVLATTGWANDIAPTDPARVYLSAPVLGAGLFLLIPFGLDQIDHGMPAGAPSAIAMGLRFGMGLSALTIGAAGTSFSGDDIGHFLFGSTLASGVLFGTVAYLAAPHPSQVQMIQNTGLWGSAFGAFLALAIAPNIEGFEAPRFGLGIALAGMGSGLVVGSLFSALDLHLPSGRSWLGSLGLISGAGAGALVYLLIGGLGGNFDPTIAGVSCLLGSGAGLALALALTDGMPGAVRFDDVSVSASIAPTEGGGMASLSGAF